MHLILLRDVQLDNVKNLRQCYLRYTVANLRSLRNVAFHWIGLQKNICSWQAVLCSWQPLGVGATNYICLFEGKMLIVH